MNVSINKNISSLNNYAKNMEEKFKIKISRTFVIAAVLHLFVASLFVCPYVRRQKNKFYNIELAKSHYAVKQSVKYSIATIKNAGVSKKKSVDKNNDKKQNDKSQDDKHQSDKNNNSESVSDSSQVLYKIGSKDNPSPLYPKFAVDNMLQGLVKISVVVNINGSVIEARIEESSGYKILDESALLAIKSWKFDVIKDQNGDMDEKKNFNIIVPIKFAIENR